MPYADKDAQREYQRLWMRRRRDQYFSGKSCSSCGSVENLELDHIDPSGKVSHRIWSWSDARRSEELAKCQVLCSACHDLKSSSELTRSTHPDLIDHKKRCPCVHCRARVEGMKELERSRNLLIQADRLKRKVNTEARKDFCVNDHAMTDDNVYITPDGRRQCRKCKRIRSRESHRRVR